MLPQATIAMLLPGRIPLIQFQRFRGKINIQRPRAPHYDRALLLAVTQPKLPKPSKTKTCFQPVHERLKLEAKIENPYNNIIAREVFNWLENSRMVAMYHMNPITQDEVFRVQVLLHKHNMHLKSYGKKIIAQAVEKTRYEAILPLFDSHHAIVFSTEQNVAQLLRITRKVPQMLLLAGMVDNTLLSRNELMAYAKLPGLQAAQAKLAQTLNMAASSVVQNLEAHQNNLVNILDVHAKGVATANDSEQTKESTESTEGEQHPA